MIDAEHKYLINDCTRLMQNTFICLIPYVPFA